MAGIDSSAASIEAARSLADAAGLEARFIQSTDDDALDETPDGFALPDGTDRLPLAFSLSARRR